MTLDDWILALHLLSAFALVGGLTLFSIVIVALWNVDRPSTVAAYMRVSKAGGILVAIGIPGTIVFGVWLALSLDRYSIWNGWILAAIVLWAIASEVGRRAGRAYDAGGRHAQELLAAGKDEPDAALAHVFGPGGALRYHVVATLVTLLILADMIWKPGA